MTERLAADAAGIARAAGLLRAGGLVAFGTETVYGLGAMAGDGQAVAAIFDAKGRPHFNPLICHAPQAAAALALGVADERARLLAAAFWPGPLTLVLPCAARSPVALLARAGLESVAVRVPRGAAARALLEAAGGAVAAPSANRSGRISPTTAAHVLAELDGRIAAVLDTGPCPVGLESTVLDLTGPGSVLLRPGGVDVERIEAVVGPVGRAITPGEAERARGLRSPGLLHSHYAPALPVRLDAAAAASGEALLAFGPDPPPAALAVNLSARGDLAEAASRLFAALRFLDDEGGRLGLAGIAAMPIPRAGLGRAIRDRLERAAAPRVS